MTHLRFAGLSDREQRAALEQIIRGTPVLMDVLERLHRLGLPDSWLSSGAIYNTVWNHLTGRPALTGIKDFDVIYFDANDLGYEAEDAVIARAAKAFSGIPVPIEVRNQARVHLWYPDHFGNAYPQLTHATQSLDYYASQTHAVAARLDDRGKIEIVAPYGLDLMFSFRLVPNHVLDNRETHERKGVRIKAVWPEVAVEPW